MEIFGLPWEAAVVYITIIGIFIAFLLERYPPDITAMGGFVLLIMLGVIDRDTALNVFSNPAPTTIAAMFILSAALEKTGCIQILGSLIGRVGGRSQLSLLLVVMPLVLVISALMNNTPVVIVLTPVLISLARKIDLPSSKVLIPLSYAAIMGGAMTMIGTSTNILVNGITVDYGLDAFGMFDITIPAAIMALCGFLYMFCIGRFLLPDRTSSAGVLQSMSSKKFMSQVLVPNDSDLIGKSLSEIRSFRGEDTEIIDILRHGDSVIAQRGYIPKSFAIKEGDRIVIESSTSEILGMKEGGRFIFDHRHSPSSSEDAEIAEDKENIVVEGVVSQASPLIGKYISSLRFRRLHNVYVIGINKMHDRLISQPNTKMIELGDTVLMEGPADALEQLFTENGLANLSVPSERAVRREKAPIAVGAILAVVLLAAFNVLPIVLLALCGAGVVIMTRCVDARDIYKTIDWSILFLIFGMLGVSSAMESSGAAAIFVEKIVSLTSGYEPIILLISFYALTSFLTEIISNNAVAALLAPIAIGVAAAVGISPEPLLVAVMFGASASFATPIGYQTNTFVYSAGGYRFKDFLVAGLPMNIIMLIVAVLIIPRFWPF